METILKRLDWGRANVAPEPMRPGPVGPELAVTTLRAAPPLWEEPENPASSGPTAEAEIEAADRL
jgi:hypothetical protein